MKQTKVTFDMSGLKDLVEAMGSEYVTRVGVLGSSGSRQEGGEFGNAEIGVIHEFGSQTKNIPQRSFLRMPLEMKSKEFMKAIAGEAAKDAFNKGDYKKVYQLMGVKAEEIIQGAFASGGYGQWAALDPKTIAKKGSASILIDLSELRSSVTSDVVNRSTVQ